MSVDDNGASLTVDAPVGTPAFVRLSDGTAAITTLPVSLASVPSHAVTNAGTFAVQATLAAETTKVIGTVNIAAAQTIAAVTALTNALPAGTNNIGDVDVLTVPADPFGANADAASATGSISAKLRFIANTGIPVTGTVTVASHAVTNAGTFAVQASLSAAIPAGTNNIGDVDVLTLPALPAGTNNIGDVDVLTVPADPFGANADAASATGSISAKLRFIASTGIPVTGTVTVGTHAVTNAGTFATQENGSALTALQLIDDIVLAEDAVHASGDKGVMALGVRQNTQADFGADGDYVPLSVDDNGGVRVAVVAGGITSATHDAVANTEGVQLMAVGSSTPPTAVSASGDAVRVWATLEGAQITAGQIVDDAAFGVATTRVVPVGMLADETSTDSVDEGDCGVPRMTLDRKNIVTQYAHATAGGHTPYKNLDVDETEDEIKGTAGKLFWIHAMNLAATKRYLKIYNNTAAGVTVGTTAPDLTFPLPTMADTNGAGFCIHFGDAGIAMGTGITVAATTGFADADTGAPGANEIIFNAGYL